MTDDLTRFEEWAVPLIAGLSSSERRKLASTIGRELKRSTSRRIAQQLNPDGSAFEPRKTQARNKKGAIRRAMFNKMRTAKFLRVQATSEGVALGFVGRVGRIARVHQYGETDKTQPGGPEVQYPARQLLGMSEDDADRVRETIMKYLKSVIINK